jgi:hypothetical protein
MKFKMTIMERCTCFLGDSVIVSAGSSTSSMWSTSLIILYELIVEKYRDEFVKYLKLVVTDICLKQILYLCNR